MITEGGGIAGLVPWPAGASFRSRNSMRSVVLAAAAAAIPMDTCTLEHLHLLSVNESTSSPDHLLLEDASVIANADVNHLARPNPGISRLTWRSAVGRILPESLRCVVFGVSKGLEGDLRLEILIRAAPARSVH